MTTPARLEPGGVIRFVTRPVGMQTILFLKALEHDTEVAYYALLCCQTRQTAKLDPAVIEKTFIQIDVSHAAGAIVEVVNNGWAACEVWSNY